MSGLFITLIFWLIGSIILLWQTSVEALRRKTILPFFSFFMAVIIMNITAALIFYESWHPDVWIIIRFLWLIPFIAFLIIWIKLIKKI